MKNNKIIINSAISPDSIERTLENMRDHIVEGAVYGYGGWPKLDGLMRPLMRKIIAHIEDNTTTKEEAFEMLESLFKLNEDPFGRKEK